MIRDHRNEILRTLLGGVGAGVVLAVAGWPQDLLGAIVTVIGAIGGVLVAFIAEALLDREGEVAALRQRVGELEHANTLHVAERELRDYQLAVARHEAAAAEASIGVWGGAYNEARETGHFLTGEAISARLHIALVEKGLDVPVPRPEAVDRATSA